MNTTDKESIAKNVQVYKDVNTTDKEGIAKNVEVRKYVNTTVLENNAKTVEVRKYVLIKKQKPFCKDCGRSQISKLSRGVLNVRVDSE